MGPLITQEHRDRVAAYIDAGEEAGAKVVVDGRDVQPDGEPGGFWLGPTLLDHVEPAMTVYTDEIFGPVLSVLRVDTYAEALERVNTNEHGNGTAIFTNDGGAARRLQNEVEVGMIGINVPSRSRWRTTPSAAGRTVSSATPTPTAPKASTSTHAARSSPAAGSTPATADSASASPQNA
jgi:acyl-CoA reductase-like NAD-dependent aldehyde dehydrogenase